MQMARRFAQAWWRLHCDERIPNSEWHNIHLAKDGWRPRCDALGLGCALACAAAALGAGAALRDLDDATLLGATLLKVALMHNVGFFYVNVTTSEDAGVARTTAESKRCERARIVGHASNRSDARSRRCE